MSNNSSNFMTDKCKQLGLTLIELMVSLVLGLLVTGIVLALFSQTKRGSIQDDAVSVMQENGRFALQILTNELSHAGHAGDMHRITDGINKPLTSPSDDCTSTWYDIVVNPIEYNVTPTGLDCIDDVAKDKTHVLVVKRTAQQPVETFNADKVYFGTD